MADVGRALSALRLPPTHLFGLAAWKAMQRLRQRHDERTACRAYTAAGAEFVARWRRTHAAGGLSAWLRRPGAGTFFVAPGEAPAWAHETCAPADLELAEATAAGTFDLLSSGPRQLGVPPRWREDLYSAQEWPLAPAGRIAFARNDGSDIRTVWELSRFYPVIALARACHATGEQRFFTAFAGQLDSFLAQNPVGRGPHWASPMDVAIRSANWILGLVFFADALDGEPELRERVLANLYTSALWVEWHREWHPVHRGNHYVANLVGLLYAGVLFRGDVRGERWLRRGADGLGRELLRQVHPDGVSFEASLGYHRLALQLFGWGADLVRRNRPQAWTGAHEARLAAMHRFLHTYTPVSGLAPLLGDNDDGHLHVLDARMLRDPRRHALGLPPAPAAEAPEPHSALFGAGGFAVLRRERDHCIVRCGAVGLEGAGSHDHNDQLSYELVLDGERLVRDSGTYCYTRDLRQRHAFRATAAHNTVQLGGQEQNPIRPDRPWRVLEDRTRTEVVAWADDERGVRLSARHHGYRARPGAPVVQRSFTCAAGTSTWEITDDVVSAASHAPAEDMEWWLHLEREPRGVKIAPGLAQLEFEGARLRVAHPQSLAFSVETVQASDRYGEQHAAPRLRLAGRVRLPVRITATFEAGASITSTQSEA